MDERCPLCGGELQPLGFLGKMRHTRCRDCGMDQHELLTDEQYDAYMAEGDEDDE